jgi:hypothetical protein
MEPQPLSFTYTARGNAPSLATPTRVDIRNWDQLDGLSIQELQLTGTIDLSTAGQVIDFNGWLSMVKFTVSPYGGPYHREPVGSHHVELTDECAVTITAKLTCGCDFGDLAITINNTVKPMHDV